MQEEATQLSAPQAAPPAERPKPPGLLRRLWRRWSHLLLFILTLTTTLFIGFNSVLYFYLWEHGALPEAIDDPLSILLYPPLLFQTLAYAAALLGFLAAHEMGHYFMCRRYRLDASLPYFLPNPLIFGTFGAVIRIRSPIRSKRALFDIGVAGPLAGFAVALPILIVGLATALVVPAESLPGDGSFLVLGEPLILKLLNECLYAGSGNIEIIMSPLAMVGWFACLVTAINLVPVSQLDGGHILYAVFGRWHQFVSTAAVVAMIVVALVTQYYGWLFWALLVALLGLRHPPLADESEKLDRPRLILAAVVALIFVGCFIPVPIELPEVFEGGASEEAPMVDPPQRQAGEQISIPIRFLHS